MGQKKPLRLLLVEDSGNDEILLLRELSRSEYEITHERVDTAEGMQSALDRKEWDIVISDYVMPKFNALEALSLLNRSGRDLPFLIVSGTIGEETAVEAMRAGAHDYLMKDKLLRLPPAIDRELREAKIRSQRAQSELALYESEEKFRFMFEHSPVPMWVADWKTLAFLEINEAAVSCYGYSRREFLQMTAPDLQTPESRSPISPSSSSGHRIVGEAIHKLKNGEFIEVEVHSDALEFGGKKLVLIISRDITQQKKTERELIMARETALEASRLKSEFLANMSHEIRTPLNGIMGATGFLLKSSLPQREKEWVEIIRASQEGLLTIVNQVLDFSKIEAGKLELESVDFDLVDLIKKTGEVFTHIAKNKGLEFKIYQDPDIPARLQGDPVQLRQVLVNLLDNAIKFTKSGQIALRVRKIGEGDSSVKMRFTIQDTGIGIQEQKWTRLFRPFSQADSSSTRQYGGTGLGLAICEKIISLMGGRINFESEWGKGSTFWFEVNLSKSLGSAETNLLVDVDTRSKSNGSKHLTAHDKRSLRILVVEDNQVNKKVIMEMVGKIGYKAHGVDDGKEAVKVLDQKAYDAILMDCQMPVMDGYEATAIIRKKETALGRRTPIIAVTAHAMKGDREKCLNAGMDDYISKPVDVESLATILQKWLTKGG